MMSSPASYPCGACQKNVERKTRLYNVKVLVVSGFTAIAFLVMN